LTTKPFSVIIPAAGNSGRMGSDKALLPYGNGLSFAEKLIKSYSEFGTQTVVVVVNKNLDLSGFDTSQLVTVLNEHTDWGRSYSIFLGSKKVQNDCTCFLHNIDNPFVGTELLNLLLDTIKPDSYVVPVYHGKGGHPVLLGNGIVGYLQNQDKVFDFREVLNQFNRIEVPYNNEQILLNINTPEDYEMFLKLI
jgi:molybdenum cofactor cytidylyltransferase